LTGPEAVSLFDDVTALRAQYPERKSAVMPALHLAQERHGWLPPDALREIAEALDLTPAYVQAVASFYDMYHLEPTGRHEVAVCTNVSCALVGAQAVVEAFEETLGITTGETT
jgi:NADH-quinone oxidoreductase subunit E